MINVKIHETTLLNLFMDSKEHHKQILNVIKNGTRIYKDLEV